MGRTAKTTQPFCRKCVGHVWRLGRLCPECLALLNHDTLVAALTVLARKAWRRAFLARTVQTRNGPRSNASYFYKYAARAHTALLALTGGAEPEEVRGQRLKAEAKLALLKVQGVT